MFKITIILSCGMLIILLGGCTPLDEYSRNYVTEVADIMQTSEAKEYIAQTAVARGTPVAQVVAEGLVYQFQSGMAITALLVPSSDIEPFLSDNPIVPDNMDIGFTPKYIPIRIAIDTKGNVLISASSLIVTDIGVFDVSASKTIISQERDQLLMIQIDDRVAIYRLEKSKQGENFKIDFSDEYDKYRLLLFEQKQDGNIILRLETWK